MQSAVIGSMELVNVKEFMTVRSWQRAELGDDCETNKIFDTFSSMGFVFEVIKLHV